MEKVVVTGLGLVTSLGCNLEKVWSNIIAGKSGIQKIPESLFESNDLAAKIAGYIPTKEENPDLGLNVSDFIPSIYSISSNSS